MLRGNLIAVSGASFLVAAIGLSTGIAGARPFCYETGPGYQKCISSPSGDYFDPIYQGPRVPDGYVPWVPDTVPSPISIPPLPSGAFTNAEAYYLNDLTRAGITGDPAALVGYGHTICQVLAGGADPNTLSQTYFTNSGSVTHAQAGAAINFAKAELCPAG